MKCYRANALKDRIEWITPGLRLTIDVSSSRLDWSVSDPKRQLQLLYVDVWRAWKFTLWGGRDQLAASQQRFSAFNWKFLLTELHSYLFPGEEAQEHYVGVYNSREFIKDVKAHPENFYVIHYSCQSLYDDNEALSPRITSIAIAHYATEQTVSFSTHSIAEELHIPREAVQDRFDEIERELLRGFYAFIRDRRDKYWIHWNMRNLTYGFEHLEHRYRVLGGNDAPVISVERRLNLNDLLADRYGGGYAAHPKLKSLMELNSGIHRHFLSGEEEVQAFQNNEFIRMHNSTLCKVGFLHSVIRKFLRGKLHTASHGLGVALDKIFEGRPAKAIGLIATAVTICVSMWQIWLWISELGAKPT